MLLKVAILAILSAQVSSVKHIHNIVQLISRTFIHLAKLKLYAH